QRICICSLLWSVEVIPNPETRTADHAAPPRLINERLATSIDHPLSRVRTRIGTEHGAKRRGEHRDLVLAHPPHVSSPKQTAPLCSSKGRRSLSPGSSLHRDLLMFAPKVLRPRIVSSGLRKSR